MNEKLDLVKTVTKQYECPVSIIYDCYFNIVI